MFIVARVRRLGPPGARRRELPPPARAYVDALAATIAAARRASEASHRSATKPAAGSARRAGLPADARRTRVAEAARGLGLDEDAGARAERRARRTTTWSWPGRAGALATQDWEARWKRG